VQAADSVTAATASPETNRRTLSACPSEGARSLPARFGTK
jgi:hypothetical protein